jgi:transcriptional regulator with XRE-family HTH domain
MPTLKQVRKRAKLGLRQLARDAGVGKDVVLRLEKRLTSPENVSHGDIVRIVRALQRHLPELTADELFPVRVA